MKLLQTRINWSTVSDITSNLAINRNFQTSFAGGNLNITVKSRVKTMNKGMS